MAVSNLIKDQIVAKIDALGSVEVVYPSEFINPKGWPAVFVKSTDMDGEFSSNAENSRVYAYRCTIAFPTGQDMVPESERNRLDYSERVINSVIDDIINAIDTDYELDNPVLYVNAADVTWGYVDMENGIAEAATITLRVYTEKIVA